MADLPSALDPERARFRIAAIVSWAFAGIFLVGSYLGDDLRVDPAQAWAVAGLAVAGGFVGWVGSARLRSARALLIAIGLGVGLVTWVVALTGGTRSGMVFLYVPLLIFSGAVLEVRQALFAGALVAAAAALPLLGGWDASYGRRLLLLVPVLVFCTFFAARARRTLAHAWRAKAALVELAQHRTEELEASYLATVAALAAALDAKDRYTEAHSREIAALAVEAGRRLGLEAPRLRLLEFGALLHDIGKIGIPGYVLNKPGRLSPEEMAIVREHPVIAERILASVPFLAPLRPIVRAAHERWDGAGYPDGLVGEEVPLESRIILGCDAFLAMSTDRPYRSALPREEVLGELRTQAGKQFDPRVVDVLLQIIESGAVQITASGLTAVSDPHPPLGGPRSWAQHLEAVEALGARLARVNGVNEIARLIGEAIVSLVPYDQCRLRILGDDGKSLMPVYFSDATRQEYSGITAQSLTLTVGEGITGWVAETKRGVVLGDAERHPKARHIRGTSTIDESVVAVPVLFEDELLGVISVLKVGLHQYSPDHLRLLTILANQAGVSIANARLIERLAASARTDPLTSLGNRRAFQERLEQAVRQPSPTPFSIVMLDVDQLKVLNDSGGHAVGDLALKRVSDVLRSHLRPDESAARWGGDEFLVFLPRLSGPSARAIAERMQVSLRAPSGDSPAVSVCVGVASYPEHGLTAADLLAAADRSMYAAKRQRAA
jgi:diguanylate cyclase (GGDEF)-like protein